MGNFLAGVNSGGESLFDKQSFMDGFVGALGTVTSLNPLGTLKIFTSFFDQAKGGDTQNTGTWAKWWNNFSTDENGRKLSKWSIANQFLGNSLVGSIAMTREEQKNTDERL